MWQIKRKLTFEDREEIRKAYKAGKTVSELAKKYGICRATIRYHLRKVERVPLAPMVDTVKIIQLYQEGKNFTEIAKLVKCAKNTATCHIKKSKYYDPNRKVVRRYKTKPPKFSDFQIKERKRIKKQIQCNHPSFKCGICKKWYDNSREQIVSHDRPDC